MRMGIVGCGDAAAAVGLASRFVRRCTIAVVCDLAEGRRQRYARRFGADPVADWHELLDRDDLDAVYLAVPHDMHTELSLAFAARGKAVLLEKPVAATLEDADALVRARPPDAKIAVNYQYRYDPRIASLLEACAARAMGEIVYAQVLVPWYRGSNYFAGASWHAKKARSGGGTLLTQGSHALDIALIACGEPHLATARTYRLRHTGTEVEDLAVGVVETASGVPVALTSSMVSRPGERVSITIYGDRGYVRYRGPGRPDLRAHGFRVRRPPVWSQLHAYAASLRAFRDWVDGGPPHACAVEDALPVMRAVDALYRSAAAGATVEL